jgi:ribonuclease D
MVTAQNHLPSPACIQLVAPTAVAYIFQLDSGHGLPASRNLPVHLAELLADNSILKVCAGWKLCRDTMQQHMPNMQFVNCIEVSTFAAKRRAVASDNASLSQLVACLLGKKLHKDSQHRFAKWRVRDINLDQARYACTGKIVNHLRTCLKLLWLDITAFYWHWQLHVLLAYQ